MHKIPGSTLRSVFGEKYRVEITPKIFSTLKTWIVKYELYKDHPLVLNSPFIGVHDMFFIRELHQPQFFEIFDINPREFAKDITTIATVDTSMNVRSDPINLVTIWLAHLTYISKLPDSHKHEMICMLLKVMHYKFFTSMIFRRYPHKAKEDIMRLVVENLDKKFDIVIYGTWKKVIEARCASIDALSHKLDRSTKIAESTYKAITEFKEDDDIFYVISDAQTRLRDKLNLITQRYYDLYDEKKTIGSYDTISTVNGEKIVRDTSGALTNMVTHLSNDILSTQQFIDNEYVNFICGLNKELKPYMFKSLLEFFTDIAIQQNRGRTLDNIKMINGEEVITGHRLLISEIIQVTYRNCINSGTNMKSKLDILKVTGNIYRSSQIQDESIQRIKRSVEYFIDRFPGTSRFNTKLALKINFIVYIILLTFKYV